MGIMIMFVTAFAVAFVVIYGAMRLVCYIKRTYCLAETWLCKVVETFECTSCKEACQNHAKLIVRASLFSFVIAAVIVITHCVR